MGWVHSTLPKFVADQLRRGPKCHASLDVRKTIEELDLLRDLSTELRRRHAIDGDEAAAYDYVAKNEGGRLDLPIHRLNASSPKVLGSAACIVDAPSVEGGALADIDVATTTRTFAEDGVAIVDNILKEETLTRLRDFVLGSTVFTRAYAQGYLGAFLGDGFGAAGVIQQVAAELRQTFPELLGDTALRQAWAYAYPRDGHPRGIDVHSDDADVSVNIWITPNKANLDSETGGLRIWNKKPPADWTFETANRDLDSINSILQDGEASYVTIPYRFNRAIFLNGHRFHQTDALHFAPGLENHRINLTFLFARRSDGTACRV